MPTLSMEDLPAMLGAVLALGAAAVACLAVVRLGLRRLAYRDFAYQPVERDDLPAAARRHFEALTPRMLAAGLRLLGDFEVRQGHTEFAVRFFLSPDGCVFGTIELWRLAFWRRKAAFGFISVLSDGTFVESSSEEVPPLPEGLARYLHFAGLRGAAPGELYAFHRREAEEMAASRCAEIRIFEAEDFAAVGNYGHRLVHWALSAQGYRVEPPPIEDERAWEIAGVSDEVDERSADRLPV